MFDRSLSVPEDVQVFNTLQDAMSSLDVPPPPVVEENQPSSKLVDQVFIIGGASLYDEALSHPTLLSRVLLTSIETDVPDCDTFLPTISAAKFQLTFRSDLNSENGFDYRFMEFERFNTDKKLGVVPPSLLLGEPGTKNFEECQYLDIIQVWRFVVCLPIDVVSYFCYIILGYYGQRSPKR
jgi:hypothetical protein